jgi:hypothetical protein
MDHARGKRQTGDTDSAGIAEWTRGEERGAPEAVFRFPISVSIFNRDAEASANCNLKIENGKIGARSSPFKTARLAVTRSYLQHDLPPKPPKPPLKPP